MLRAMWRATLVVVLVVGCGVPDPTCENACMAHDDEEYRTACRADCVATHAAYVDLGCESESNAHLACTSRVGNYADAECAETTGHDAQECRARSIGCGSQWDSVEECLGIPECLGDPGMPSAELDRRQAAYLACAS